MLVLIKGAGDLATGIGWRLHNCGFSVVMTDLPAPTAVRRTVAFCQALYDGTTLVEGITARRCQDAAQVGDILAAGEIPVLPDPECHILPLLRPQAVVDAILAKRNLGTRITDAPVVIGVGPGFTAGVDCHCAVETQRGHALGRCLRTGSPAPNTGIPGNVGGYTVERVLRTPCAGIFHPRRAIGDLVQAGEIVAVVDNTPLPASITGILRGLLPEGLPVPQGFKAGDIDPRCDRSHCFTISDKALAVAGGVLEGILSMTNPHPPLF